jgi:hypothetical protein
MSRYRNIPASAPGGQINWWLVGPVGLAGLFFWPLLIVAVCLAVSQSRGPNHYTKFVVPYAYRFKWDPVWIALAVLAAPCTFMLYAWAKVDASMGVWGWISALVMAVASLRVIVWLSFRFPLTAWFFTIMLMFLLGIGWRARFLF